MSSPLRPGASPEEAVDHYKKLYEQLETDLADYQASSKELEEQLERDVENAEKNERKLKEQIEKLKYDADEWKTKHQQSKTEANSAQNALQKEITTLRDTNRSMQLKLRDTEVINDDYERQARNTESSLEDMESKYNVAIERGVLLESEVKSGESERETLRIENQRLRDELSELRVESEITMEKLRVADDTIERLRSRKPSPLAVESLRARSPGSEASGITPSSPTASTPPPKSDSASEAPTPPSPPLSDTPANARPEPKTPISKRRSLIPDAGATPRPGLAAPKPVPKHARGPSTNSSGSGPTSDAKAMRPPMRPRQVSRPSNLGNEGLPRSDSLYQIRSLRGRMQKIEERVQSARSKLPAPRGGSTPKGSPRGAAVGSALGDTLPASVTMRRSVRRTPSNFGSQAGDTSDLAVETPSRRESTRMSTGIPRPPSVASDRLSIGGIPRPPSVASERPTSALDRPPSAAAASRPSSRHSLVSGSASLSGNRPGSRIGARTPVGEYAGTNGAAAAAAPPVRSSSSIGGNYATVHGTPRSHRPSASVSELRRKAAESEDSGLNVSPGRRGTIDRSGLPTPFASSKRQSANLPQPKLSKRTSTGLGTTAEKTEPGAMRPPPRRQMSDVGETY